MNLLTKKLPQKGFTLVELLAVTAIIIALFTISSVVILRHVHSSKNVEAAVMMEQFALIVEDWERDFYSYPHGSALPNSPENDEAYLTTNDQFMSNMLGENASVNQDMINYLATFPIVDDGESGIALANDNGSGGGGNASAKSLIY